MGIVQQIILLIIVIIWQIFINGRLSHFYFKLLLHLDCKSAIKIEMENGMILLLYIMLQPLRFQIHVTELDILI